MSKSNKGTIQTWFPTIVGIVIVLLLGGGILAWQYSRAPKAPEGEVGILEEEEVVAEDETAGWKTYRNEEYGFKIKYPPLYQVSDELVRESFYDYQISRIASFSYADSTMFKIYADNSSSNLISCLKSYDNKDLTQTKEINGNKFYIYWDKLRDAAMGGQRGLQSQYRIIHNNYCYILHYEFSWRVSIGGTKNGGAEPGGTETAEQEANIEKQTAELEQMLSTFRFLK